MASISAFSPVSRLANVQEPGHEVAQDRDARGDPARHLFAGDLASFKAWFISTILSVASLKPRPTCSATITGRPIPSDSAAKLGHAARATQGPLQRSLAAGATMALVGLGLGSHVLQEAFAATGAGFLRRFA